MSKELSKEEIILKSGWSFKSMQEYADQQVKKEAIEFGLFLRGYEPIVLKPNYWHDTNEEYTTEQLYDLFKQK